MSPPVKDSHNKGRNSHDTSKFLTAKKKKSCHNKGRILTAREKTSQWGKGFLPGEKFWQWGKEFSWQKKNSYDGRKALTTREK